MAPNLLYPWFIAKIHNILGGWGEKNRVVWSMGRSKQQLLGQFFLLFFFGHRENLIEVTHTGAG